MMIIRKLFQSNDPSQSAASRRQSGSHQPQTDSTNVLARHGVSTAKNHVASTQADTNYTTLNSSNGATTSTTTTTGLSWKSSFSCANLSGNFSYFVSCTQFVECVGKVPYVKMCPKGTKFHPTLLICDKEKSVLATTNCSSSGGVKLLSNNYDPLKKSTSDKVKTTRGGGGRVIKRETSSSREDRKMSRRCSTGSTHDYYIQPHSQYCNKFEICSNGKIQEQTCGLGALFNPLSLVCDLPYNVDCESRRIDFSTYDCQPGDKYKTSHPDKCEQFIECDIKGTLRIKECPPSTAYDFEEEECVHIYKAKCKKPISLEHDSSFNVNYGHSHLRRHKRSTSNRLNLACTFNYIAPHPEFCDKFVECEDGRIFIKDCGPGTAYNPRLGQCDWPYNVRQAVSQDCSRYRQCLGRQYVVKTCREDTIFDPEAGKCVIATGKFDYDADCRQQQFITPLPS
ncbi:uncharacterized protein LOC110850680 isoform X1 [Folsomia candida]|nr:uncharacterized protein LOC110850680 isoform X1 [Folsomia candida]